MKRAAIRPYVICHMCTTLDGKILGTRWGRLPGGQDSANLFERTAASFSIPAWLVGTTTMRELAQRELEARGWQVHQHAEATGPTVAR